MLTCKNANPVVSALAECIQNKITSLASDCTANPTITGVVNTVSLGDIDAQLSGNMSAILVSIFITTIVSLATPQNFDWTVLRERTDSFLIEVRVLPSCKPLRLIPACIPGRLPPTFVLCMHAPRCVTFPVSAVGVLLLAHPLKHLTLARLIWQNDEHAHLAKDGEDSAEAMDKAFWWIVVGATVISLVLVVLWPALALPAKVFDKKYFAFWVAIAFIWGHFAFAATVLLPCYEFIFPAKEGDYSSDDKKEGDNSSDDKIGMQPVSSDDKIGMQPVVGFTMTAPMSLSGGDTEVGSA